MVCRIVLWGLLLFYVYSTGLELQAYGRFSKENKPDSKESWRSKARVADNEMEKVSGKTFTSAQTLVNRSGIIYEDCVFEGPVRISDCSSMRFVNCRFNLKGITNKFFVELYYTDDIVFTNNTFENAYYDNFRHYATIYSPDFIYSKETIRGKEPMMTDITYNTKWVNAFFIHHGGDVTFSETTLKDVWVVRESSLKKFSQSLKGKLKEGLRDVNWKSLAPYVFRFEGNTRLIKGEVIGAKSFEGLSYAPTSSYGSLNQKMPKDLDAAWDEVAKKVSRFRRGMFLVDMICRDGFSNPDKRSSASTLFKGTDKTPGSVVKILSSARLALVSKKRMYEYEVPVKRLAFKESEITVLKKFFKGSWHCAFRLLYLCEKFQRSSPEKRSKIKKSICFYAMALLHGMHPPRSINYSNGPRHAGWNHSLFFAERKKGSGKNKEEQVFINTKGAAYQGKPLLSCSSVCLWALSRARQCGVNFDQDLYALAMLSFRNSISKYSVSFPHLPENKDQIIVENMDRIYLMNSFWKPSKGLHLSDFNKPFFDSEMLPRFGMVYLAMTSTGMSQFTGDIEKLRKLMRYSSGCASAAHGAPSFGLWIFGLSNARLGDEAAEALWAQHANLLQHHLSKIWIQFMPVADTKAESDAPPTVYSHLKIENGSQIELNAQWQKTSEKISEMKYFKQQQRLFYKGKESRNKTYDSPMPGYANTLVKRFSRFKEYIDEHSIKGKVSVNSSDPYYPLYIGVQSAKSLTSYSYSSTEFLSGAVALRRSRPWVVCMPGMGGYGNPIMLKAEQMAASTVVDDKSRKKISYAMQLIGKEEILFKRDALYNKLLALLESVAKKVQRSQKEILQLNLPEMAWRTQPTQSGQLLFLTLGGDSLLSTKVTVKTDTGETLLKSERVSSNRPLYFCFPLAAECKELDVEWVYGQMKQSDKLTLVENEEGHLRQITPVINAQ